MTPQSGVTTQAAAVEAAAKAICADPNCRPVGTGDADPSAADAACAACDGSCGTCPYVAGNPTPRR